MKIVKNDNSGFITMIVLLVLVIGLAIGLAWWRVNGANVKKNAENAAKKSICENVTENIGGKQVTKNVCK